MKFQKIEITKNDEWSNENQEYYIITFKYEFDGEDDETVLEHVERKDIHLAIEAIMQDPVNFREMYP